MSNNPEEEYGDDQRDCNDGGEAISSLMVGDDRRRGAAMVSYESRDILQELACIFESTCLVSLAYDSEDGKVMEVQAPCPDT